MSRERDRDDVWGAGASFITFCELVPKPGSLVSELRVPCRAVQCNAAHRYVMCGLM